MNRAWLFRVHLGSLLSKRLTGQRFRMQPALPGGGACEGFGGRRAISERHVGAIDALPQRISAIPLWSLP